MKPRSMLFTASGVSIVMALACYSAAFILVAQFYELYASWVRWLAVGGIVFTISGVCCGIYGIVLDFMRKR